MDMLTLILIFENLIQHLFGLNSLAVLVQMLVDRDLMKSFHTLDRLKLFGRPRANRTKGRIKT